MGPEGAVNVVWGDEVRNASDPRAEFERRAAAFHELSRPIKPAEELRMDDVIDPRDTRRVLAHGLHLSIGRRRFHRALPPKKHGVSPV
jgi:acetyl-CoA/propionyl-CoA carboxylase